MRIEENLESKKVEYNNIYIEAIFTDKKGKKHSRLYPLNSDITNLSNVDILTGIKEHEILKNFLK